MEKTIENKKKIAKFMEFPIMGKFVPITDELAQTLYNDWNELMPVVEKIFKDQYLDLGYDSFKNEQAHFVQDALSRADIKKLYKAVIEFINWYNKQNTNESEPDYEKFLDAYNLHDAYAETWNEDNRTPEHLENFCRDNKDFDNWYNEQQN